MVIEFFCMEFFVGVFLGFLFCIVMTIIERWCDDKERKEGEKKEGEGCDLEDCGLDRLGDPSVLDPDDPSTWSRSQLLHGFLYMCDKVHSLRDKYEK